MNLGKYRALAALLLAATAGGALARDHDNQSQRREQPIVLAKSGGFVIGGKVVENPKNPEQHISCDHGYMEYFIPETPRKSSLVMWHSSSTQVWQNRWDGGEGYKDMFLRRNYPVYLWDGPRVGRANYSCESVTYTPKYLDEFNFHAWNLGKSYPNWFPGVQFPTESKEAWAEATASRYDEFDFLKNVELETDAAAVAADSGRLGKQIVYLTNSAGGLRAMVTTTKAKQDNIKAIVTYESIGYVFPQGDPESPAPCTDPNACPFGPIVVPMDDFKKLTKLKIQFVWGDNRSDDADPVHQYVVQSRLAAKLINKYGGHAEVLMLGDQGLKGSTHIAFADMDNAGVAALLDKFLKQNKLDSYQTGAAAGHWVWSR